MKTFLSEQHATNRNKDSILHAQTRCRSVHARGFTAGQKNCGKSGLSRRASGPLGLRAAGPRGRRGPAFSKPLAKSIYYALSARASKIFQKRTVFAFTESQSRDQLMQKALKHKAIY